MAFDGDEDNTAEEKAEGDGEDILDPEGCDLFWSGLIQIMNWSRNFMLNIMTFDAKVMIYHA